MSSKRLKKWTQSEQEQTCHHHSRLRASIASRISKTTGVDEARRGQAQRNWVTLLPIIFVLKSARGQRIVDSELGSSATFCELHFVSFLTFTTSILSMVCPGAVSQVQPTRHTRAPSVQLIPTTHATLIRSLVCDLLFPGDPMPRFLAQFGYVGREPVGKVLRLLYHTNGTCLRLLVIFEEGWRSI